MPDIDLVHPVTDFFKICRVCKQTKNKSCFSKRTRYRDGLESICKPCKAIYMAEYRKKNRKRLNANIKRYRSRPERKEKARAYLLKVRFGITVDDYNEMFIEQGGCCAICGTHQSQTNQRLNVDHCHDTGDVRGLLCNPCNKGLGAFGDNHEIIKNALKYLKMTGEKDA